jgi:hypothetical protein
MVILSSNEVFCIVLLYAPTISLLPYEWLVLSHWTNLFNVIAGALHALIDCYSVVEHYFIVL